jgi:hypothetical protein
MDPARSGKFEIRCGLMSSEVAGFSASKISFAARQAGWSELLLTRQK